MAGAINATFHRNANGDDGDDDGVNATRITMQHPMSGRELGSEEVYTVVYIGLALLFVFVVGFVSTVYMRAVREHRKEQAIR